MTTVAEYNLFRAQNSETLQSKPFCAFVNRIFDGGQNYMNVAEMKLALEYFENLQFNQKIIEDLDKLHDRSAKSQSLALKAGALRKVAVGYDVVYLKKANALM